MAILPTVMTAAGLTPRTLTEIRADLIQRVTAANPGYTANLPASLIEDISSTDTYAISMMEQARIDVINSVTPYGANAFLSNALGALYGVPIGALTNTSVYVLFTGTVGFVIPKGFTVSDGTHQYVVRDGGVIPTGGSVSLYCLASASGSWAVPANTVTSFITSVPGTITLACNNPTSGTPGTGVESDTSYHSRVIEACRASAVGSLTYLKAEIKRVPGVNPRLVSVQRGTGNSFKVLVGGGDPYSVAYAIFAGLFDVFDLQGSATTARNVTVSINDYPDIYPVVFINPPAQLVGVQVTWNTTTLNFTADNAVIAATMPVLVDYVNSLPIGYALNTVEMSSLFLSAVAGLIDNQFVSHLAFSVTIDGVPTSPTAGTNLIAGDSEGYFYTTSAQFTYARA